MLETLNNFSISQYFDIEFGLRKRFDSSLEKEYRRLEFKRDMRLYRYIALFGIVLYGSFYIADSFIIKEGLFLHQVIRLMIVLPFSILILGLSYNEKFIKSELFVEGTILLSLIMGQIFHLVMSYADTTPHYYYLFVTLPLVLWGNSFTILKFNRKVLFSVLNLILMYFFLKEFKNLDSSNVYFQLIVYSTLIIISLLSAFLIERSRRRIFLSALKLKSNANGFKDVIQLTAHELKTSMRVIHGLSYIIKKDEEKVLSDKSKESLDLLREHVLVLNENLEKLRNKAELHS